ncbi:nitrophenyl compound nitroreductase subunit ArsF family protein [Candidatus Omnitrophota bacterium]
MRLKFLAGVLCIFLLGIGFTADAIDIKNEDASGSHIVVYYFHGNFRCASCHKIENYTKETVEKYFDKQVQAGDILYKTVNVEKKGNAHFVEDYQLYTKSVVLSLVRDGKEVKHKNLTKVWEYLGNKTKFENYEKKEIEDFLKEL